MAASLKTAGAGSAVKTDGRTGRGRGGREPYEAERRRSKSVSVLLTSEEYARLRKASRDEDRSLSSFTRHLVLNGLDRMDAGRTAREGEASAEKRATGVYHHARPL